LSIDGTYAITVNSPIGKQEGKLTLKTSGEKLDGTMEASLGKMSFTGTAKDNDLAWTAEVSSAFGKAILDFKAKVSGIEITGQVALGAFGSFPFNGKKV
jgi:hypothetical protein